MKYRSTRGSVSGLSFEDVILGGYAPDGGMFMPEVIPTLDISTIKSWYNLSYKEIVTKICSLFIEDEIPGNELVELVDRAYKVFSHEEVIPLQTLKSGATFMEMFHGQTMAFKDLSMCCAAQLIEYFLKKNSTRATLLIATSGDTGSSALEAVRHTKNLDAIVLLPKNRISPIQEHQMTTVISDNCHVIRADGTSDDTDPPIKNLFCDADFATKYKLSSLNSVNWGRVMVQIAHHFYGAFQVLKRGFASEAKLYIPTGGLGNTTAACVAHRMGLPIQIVCTVTNDAVARAVNDKEYALREINISLASAMNIQVPYNWERILYLYSNMDTDMIRRVLTEYENSGKAQLPSEIIDKIKLVLRVELVSDEDILVAMKRCYKENELVVCPHTATALTGYYRSADNGNNSVLLGVASPAKFTEAVAAAGLPTDNKLNELLTKPTRYTDWERDEDWEMNLRNLITKLHT